MRNLFALHSQDVQAESLDTRLIIHLKRFYYDPTFSHNTFVTDRWTTDDNRAIDVYTAAAARQKGFTFYSTFADVFFSFNIKTCFNVFFAKILVLTFVIFVVTAATEEDLSAG